MTERGFFMSKLFRVLVFALPLIVVLPGLAAADSASGLQPASIARATSPAASTTLADEIFLRGSDGNRLSFYWGYCAATCSPCQTSNDCLVIDGFRQSCYAICP